MEDLRGHEIRGWLSRSSPATSELTEGKRDGKKGARKDSASLSPAPVVHSATKSAAYPGDGPSLAGRLAARNGPDRPTLRISDDESVVGLVGVARPMRYHPVPGDLMTRGPDHRRTEDLGLNYHKPNTKEDSWQDVAGRP